MKRLISFLFCAVVALNIWAVQSVHTNATDVTIFLNGAQVHRQANLKLNQGKQTVEFVDLSYYLNINSLQVGIDGKVAILGVKREYDFTESEEKNAKVASYEQQIDAKKLEISKIKAEQEVLASQLDFLEVNKTISGKNEAVSLQALQQTLEFYSDQINSIKNKQIESKLLLDKANTELKQLQNELSQIKGVDTKTTSKVIVELSAQQAGTYKINLSYFVTQANWSAAYDLRATTIGEPIALTYKAKIYQNTGENWKNVNIVLSSGNPTQNNNAPSLSVYKLSEPQVHYDYEYDVVAEEAVMPMMAAKSTRMVGASYGAANNVVATEVSTNLTAFEIAIKEKYDVLSNGNTTTVDVGVFDLPTKYEYIAIPKRDKNAFLMAKATDWGKHHLINGTANIYFENTYVGQTTIRPDQATDTIAISLGRDKSIVVNRTELADYNKKKILSSKAEQTKGWLIDVRNQKNKQIEIIVSDQIPISSTSSIEVSSELDGGVLEPKSGKVSWRLLLQPNSQTKKTLTYKVKYPKDWNLSVE